jgi:hypothetical protein
MAVKMKVVGLMVDPTSNGPVVVLRDEKGDHLLPIWIGILEASSIAAAMEKLELNRPMTHDLFVNVLAELGVTVTKIVVNDLQDNTYYARIHLTDTRKKAFDVDARPSDSIALALRVGADIYVEDSVLTNAIKLDKEMFEKMQKAQEDRWKEMLENLDEDELGKYRM